MIFEIKAVDSLAPIHEAQPISYLKLSGCRVGPLINFNVKRLRDAPAALLMTFLDRFHHGERRETEENICPLRAQRSLRLKLREVLR
jgi:hypothetical protein